MKFSVVLMKSEPCTDDGYPIYIRVAHLAKKPKKMIGRAFPEHFSNDAQMVNDSHPDFVILAQKILDYKLRAKKIILTGKITSPESVLAELLRRDVSGITLQEYFAEWKTENTALAVMHDKAGDLKARNKVNGYVKVMDNAVTQFSLCAPAVGIAAIDAKVLERFKKQRRLAGNSKSTISLYLRSISKLYNDAVRINKLPDAEPFKGVYKDLKVKSSQAKKKYLDAGSVRALENAKLGIEHGRARDLFLLQFYFGGCDLTDIYFLKKIQVRKGRVFFERGKTDVVIDLAVHPKAKVIIERHTAADGEYLFPYKKTAQFYTNFRRRQARLLVELQDKQNEVAKGLKDDSLRIDVLPEGGNLAIKVARHTFANIAKGLMLHPDLIRELMGHERNDVDNYYKDRFPQNMRDEALFKIIE